MNLSQLIQFNLDKSNIPHIFSNQALAIANSYTEPTRADIKGREDLRKTPLCTIDGETSRDFDDAVYCERWKKDGFHLIVSIADVARYVHENTTLDKEAYLRGNSVYYPATCIPMLPEALSNKLCSLMPNVDRLALTVHIYLDGKGKVKQKHATASIIHSHARLTYTKVQDFLDGLKTDIPHKVQNSLVQLERLYKVRRQRKADRYSFDHENDDVGFTIENGYPTKIVRPKRMDSNKLIEECMILANVSVAQILEEHGEFCVNRYHAAPTGKKLEKLNDLLASHNLDPFPEDEEITPKHLWDCIQKIPEEFRPEFKRSLLRGYEKAVYCADNKGHFGLALAGYAHFTSPIRRYGDLIIHRLMYRCLKLPGWQKYGTKLNLQKLRTQCEHITKTETRAKNSCYLLDDQLATVYYCNQSKKNHPTAGTYEATVVSIFKKETKESKERKDPDNKDYNPTGLLVSFDGNVGRAQVPLSSIKDGFYTLDEKNGSALVDQKTGKTIAIGSNLTIKLKTFNVKTGHMIAEPVKKHKPTDKRLTSQKGKVFQARIASLSKKGISIKLQGEEGLAFVPMRMLKDDYYVFIKRGNILKGRNHKKIYKRNMKLSVKVVFVDLKSQKLICEIV